MSSWLRNHINFLREINNQNHNTETAKTYTIIRNEIETQSFEDVDQVIVNEFIGISVEHCNVSPVNVQSVILSTWASILTKLKRMDTDFVKLAYGEKKFDLEDTLLPLYKVLVTADSLDLKKLLLEANKIHHAEVLFIITTSSFKHNHHRIVKIT